MKLRQKLAMVLAATMVVTAVPVVTMAKSTANITAGDILVGTKDKALAKDTTLELKIDNDIKSTETFYITLENAELVDWENTDFGITTGSAITVTAESKTELEVTVNSHKANEKISFTLPAGSVKLTGGEAVFVIDGAGTSVTSQKVAFATTSEAKGNVTVGTVSNIYTDEATLPDITISEPYAGAFNTDDKDGYEFEIQLNNSDFKFTEAGDVVAERGLAGHQTKFKVSKVDDDIIKVTIAPEAMSTTTGRIVLTGIKVKATEKAPTTGDLTVRFSGDLVAKEDYKVATVAEFGATLTSDKKDVVAGRKTELNFKLAETIENSLNQGRKVEFVLNEGYFPVSELTTGMVGINEVKEGKEVVGFEGFEYEVKSDDKFSKEFKLDVVVPVDVTGEIKVTADGRALAEELEVVVAEAKAPVTVESKAAKLELGVKGQKAGEITITETEKGMIKVGRTTDTALVIDIAGVSLDKVPTVEVTAGDLRIGDAELNEDKTQIIIPVTRASQEASTIVIKELPITTSNSMPNGTWDAKVGGKAISEFGKITVADFIVVGEGFSTVETTITNGATEMVVNGVKVALDAPAYLENGKMMVPLRAVAEAFGIATKDIVYNAGEIVVFANGRTVALTIGSTDAYVNGAKMTLANPAKIVNDRTTVPVGDLARLLGLSVEWDNTTKTATFAN